MSTTAERPELALLRHVNATFPELRDIEAAGEAVEGLLAHPGWLHVCRLVGQEVAEIDRKLDGYREPLSQAEYAMAHGRRGGLRGAEEAAKAIVARAKTRFEEQRRRHEGAAEPALEGR